MGKEYPPPNITGAEYLVHHLSNMGWVSSSGMGIVPISFTEIKNYIDVTECSLTGEEALILRKMSEQYCKYVQDKNPKTKAPYTTST
jgi:hypothetical protein